MRAFHRVFFAIWLLAFPCRKVSVWLLDHPDTLAALVAIAALVGLIVLLHRSRPVESAGGIRFVGAVQVSALPIAAGARCLVCRSELGGEIIYCASCHTPHHRECFTYAGACSVYACRAREFRRAA